MVTDLVLLACTVLAAPAEPPVDFDTQVIPVLTKAGCNSGQCHGSAAGRGGFRLSLWGSRPAADYDAITRHLEGRHINLTIPQQSLLLLKASESVSHGGGTRLEMGSEGYERLSRWIAEGAARHQSRTLVELEVTPTRAVAERGSVIPVRVEALLDDGSREDVTRWAVVSAADTGAIEWDEQQQSAVALRAGQSMLVVRYLDELVPIQIRVPFNDQVPQTDAAAKRNFVDEEILAVAGALRLPLSPPADDATFLRRVYLDLTGQLPPLTDLEAFLEDPRQNKQEVIVDRLLASPAFIRYWSYKLAKLLRVRGDSLSGAETALLQQWLAEQLARNVGFDELVAELLLAEGDCQVNAPANVYGITADARAHAEYVGEVFMGVRLGCANCHDHPLDQWSQDDYHGLAAIFAGVQRGRVIRIGRGEVTHPRTGDPAQRRLPGDRYLEPQEEGCVALAAWLRQVDHPYFGRAIVNRLWKSMMGRGLVEPVDDLSTTNPATHPHLLDRLTTDFVAHGYNIRHTLRMIASSASYGRSSEVLPGNEIDDRFYSHALVRPLESEVLLDAVSHVTGASSATGERSSLPRAIDPPAVDRDTSGASGSACGREADCPPDASVSLAYRLYLLNGPILNARIEDRQGRLTRWLHENLTDMEIVERFYLLALSRAPRSPERQYWEAELAKAQNQRQRRQVLEDFLWSLLSSQSFRTNH